MSNVEEFSQEELLRIIKRDRATKEMLTNRLAALVLENAELLAIVQELQTLLKERDEAKANPDLDNGHHHHPHPHPQSVVSE